MFQNFLIKFLWRKNLKDKRGNFKLIILLFAIVMQLGLNRNINYRFPKNKKKQQRMDNRLKNQINYNLR